MVSTDINTVIIPIGISLFVSSMYGAIVYIRNNKRFRSLDTQIDHLRSLVNNLQNQVSYPPPVQPLPQHGAYAIPLPYSQQHMTVTI